MEGEILSPQSEGGFMRYRNTSVGIVSLLFLVMGLGPMIDSGWGADPDVLLPRVPVEQREQAIAMRNPHEVTQKFVQGGKALYYGKALCSACHGLDGSGKQPGVSGAPTAHPLPTNFADGAWQAARSDGELFWILKHGSHGTDMAPYLPLFLTAEEAWQIVTYLRSFGQL